jgi:2,3-bisphosphoglycerate-independent phosphoglycerate mutase
MGLIEWDGMDVMTWDGSYGDDDDNAGDDGKDERDECEDEVYIMHVKKRDDQDYMIVMGTDR